MKRILIAILVVISTLSCTEKKEVPKESTSEIPVKEVAPEIPVKETVPPPPENDPEPLTRDLFEKGGNVTKVTMKSMSSGKMVSMKDFKGKKIIFDFWSSWCEPCIEMFPIINKLKKEIEDKKQTLKIISISVDPMPGKVKEIMKKKKVLFEVLNAPVELAGSGILMPYMAIADENGIIISTHTGKHTYEEILKMIEKK